jgi:hypothetical protein
MSKTFGAKYADWRIKKKPTTRSSEGWVQIGVALCVGRKG